MRQASNQHHDREPGRDCRQAQSAAGSSARRGLAWACVVESSDSFIVDAGSDARDGARRLLAMLLARELAAKSIQGEAEEAERGASQPSERRADADDAKLGQSSKRNGAPSPATSGGISLPGGAND